MKALSQKMYWFYFAGDIQYSRKNHDIHMYIFFRDRAKWNHQLHFSGWL